jgi:hypothetical protein
MYYALQGIISFTPLKLKFNLDSLKFPEAFKEDAHKNLFLTSIALSKAASYILDCFLTELACLSASGVYEVKPELRKAAQLLFFNFYFTVENLTDENSQYVIATTSDSDCSKKIKDALISILVSCNLSPEQIAEWLDVCSVDISADIRSDAVFVNRRAMALDKALKNGFTEVNEEGALDLIKHLYGSVEEAAALFDPKVTNSDCNLKDLAHIAKDFFSRRFGQGEGADFLSLTSIYSAIKKWASFSLENIPAASDASSDAHGHEYPNTLNLLDYLFDNVEVLRNTDMEENFSKMMALVSVLRKNGHKSGVLTILKEIEKNNRLDVPFTQDDLQNLLKASQEAEEHCSKSIGDKGERAYLTEIFNQAEQKCGVPFNTSPKNAKFFKSALEQALERLVAHFMSVAAQERERQTLFAQGTELMEKVELQAINLLDKFRSNLEKFHYSPRGFEISSKQILVYKKRFNLWKKQGCTTLEQRQKVLTDLKIKCQNSRGDPVLFHYLCGNDVIESYNPLTDISPLDFENYVKARLCFSRASSRSTPMLRHIHPFFSPAILRFGESRMDVYHSSYKDPKTDEPNLFFVCLFNGEDFADTPLHWKSKRIYQVLALDYDKDPKHESSPEVAVNTRHGCLAAGINPKEPCQVSGIRTRHSNWAISISPDKVSLGKLASYYDRLAKKSNTSKDSKLQKSSETSKVSGVSDVPKSSETSKASVASDVPQSSETSNASGAPEVPQSSETSKASGTSEVLQSSNTLHEQELEKIINNFRWYVNFNMKVMPHGPYSDYLKKHNLDTYGIGGMPICEGLGLKRGTLVREKLCRLPENTRALGIDQGLKHSIACVIGITHSKATVDAAFIKAGLPCPGENDLSCCLELKEAVEEKGKKGKKGKKEKTKTLVFRRTGPDKLPDGSDNPSPWLMLESQFMLKVPGEFEGEKRELSTDEMIHIHELECSLGIYPAYLDRLFESGFGDSKSPKGQQARKNKIAERYPQYGSGPTNEDKKDNICLDEVPRNAITAYGKLVYTVEKIIKGLTSLRRVLRLLKDKDTDNIPLALKVWWDLIYYDNGVIGDFARKIWSDHLEILPDNRNLLSEPKAMKGSLPKNINNPIVLERICESFEKELLKKTNALEDVIQQIRDVLFSSSNSKLDINYWYMGGLSLERINTLENFIKGVMRPFAQFLEAEKALEAEKDNEAEKGTEAGKDAEATKGTEAGKDAKAKKGTEAGKDSVATKGTEAGKDAKAKKGTEASENFDISKIGEEELKKLNSLKKERMKTLVSLVISAALNDSKGKYDPKYKGKDRNPDLSKQCPFIILEDFFNFTPDSSRTRRENRIISLMKTSGFEKFLEYQCWLYDIKLVKVPPSYTSRMNSRTGGFGIRVMEVSPLKFMNTKWIRAKVAEAKERKSTGEAHYEDELFIGIDNKLKDLTHDQLSNTKNVFIPSKGGSIFLSGSPEHPLMIDADLNAAFNIAILAFSDPDWEGSYTKILVDANTVPDNDKYKGSPAIPKRKPLASNLLTEEEKLETKRSGRLLYLWRSHSTDPIDASSQWLRTWDFFGKVMAMSLKNLAKINHINLFGSGHDP